LIAPRHAVKKASELLLVTDKRGLHENFKRFGGGYMGRPIGSMNRQKPFADALRLASLSGGGRRLRIIAERLAEKAEQGDLQAIQQIADRLDGKCAQVIERGDAPMEAMTDQQLMAIIQEGSRGPLPVLICGPDAPTR
jgi:hypothetical protein